MVKAIENSMNNSEIGSSKKLSVISSKNEKVVEKRKGNYLRINVRTIKIYI